MTTVLSPLRQGRITGSRLPGILGLSPYTDRAGVMRQMVREHFGAEPEFTGNIATDYGSDHELDGITGYEQLRSVMVHSAGDMQDIVLHPEHDFLAVTPDGLVGDDGLVEVKCPFRASYTHISERPDYESQARLQMECTGRDWCDFVVWRPSGVSVSRIDRDPSWLPLIMPTLTEFIDELAGIVADDDAAAPFLAPLVDERADPEWQYASYEYLEALAERDRADQALSDARDVLLKLSGDMPSRGCGVQVIVSERKGGVDKAAAKADGVDVDQYRKPGTVVHTVRRTAATS